jgi:two-component system, response regulator PdtaR
MRRKASRAFAQQLPQHQAAPARRPVLVYSRDDASRGRPETGAERRILVVEDDFLVAEDIEAALTDGGFEVIGVAESADEAIRLAQSGEPALIVMDIRLIGARDGIDAALEIFHKHRIRCIFATAHVDEHAKRRAEPAQPLGWVQKPYSMASLVALVKKVWSEDPKT